MQDVNYIFEMSAFGYHRIYQERATQFQQDLEHSQERELLAVQQLNESVTHAEMALAERDTYAKMVSK